MLSKIDNQRLTRNLKGLRSAIMILEKWGLNDAGQSQLLDIPSKQLHSPESIEHLGTDQVSRISYLLNIHASLRELFQNPQNQYGFMKAVNHNAPFHGQAPLAFIRLGEISVLKEVFEHLEHLKYGQ